ncbi:hypothetical protein GIB67_039026 [Kingdonia uniflora]|uniref:BTB domain-containing protein n=1 Tax=Kingdonia uniflora TaxID=39325 RepID=A0A7J7LKW1_9MAGN|nr:hypothetical protein GIB67_039026 [Kingdonia uniflora]
MDDLESEITPSLNEAGVGLCYSLAFRSYWISIYDGLISIGKGKHPFQNHVFQWLDTKPNCSVQYVGLCGWDKHVGYRYINMMSFKKNQSSSWKHVISHDGNEGEVDDEDESKDRYEKEKVVPVHEVILGASGSFPISSCNEDSIQLLGVDYLILHALLYVQRLTQILSTGDYYNLDIYIEGHGLVAQVHKLILSLWSIPFMKMFTNRMRESRSSEIFLSDVSLEAFAAMFQFMYHGDIDMKNSMDIGNLSIQHLLLAYQFGIAPLHQECYNTILDYLSKVNGIVVVHCGFYSEKGGFKLSEEDKSYMRTCKVVVTTPKSNNQYLNRLLRLEVAQVGNPKI